MAESKDIDDILAEQEAEEAAKDLKPLENAGLPPVDPDFDKKNPDLVTTETPASVDVSPEELIQALSSEKRVDDQAERTKVDDPTAAEIIEAQAKPTASPRVKPPKSKSQGTVKSGEVRKVELIEYTVGVGEKLRHIAARFGTSATAIEKLNHLHNARHLVPGQVLMIKVKKGK